MKHTLLYQDWLEGWQYGVHKALEDEIVRQTNAEIVIVPENQFEKKYKRMEHGRPFDFFRKYVKKAELAVDADVAWHVLMSPGDYNLDLFKKWYANVKYRVVYVFDTFENLEKPLIHAFKDDTFNIHITSFNDSVPYLEKITGKKWYSIEMAAPDSFFTDPPPNERLIPFASFGRRLPNFHEALKEFITTNNLYYEFSMFDGTVVTKFDPYMYVNYAWHVSHSIFNVCWPVEVTSPNRAGSFSPITPRWYEVASAGTCIIGRKPKNDFFNEYLHPDLVIDIDPTKSKSELIRDIEKVWQNRETHLNRSRQLRAENIHRWTWKNRVERMLNLIDTVNF